MCDCSGEISGLSGRIVSLEATILSFPTSSDFNALSALNTNRFNTLDSRLLDIVNKLNTLEGYSTALKLSLTSLRGSFTGHTGLVAKSGHHGGLTGELP